MMDSNIKEILYKQGSRHRQSEIRSVSIFVTYNYGTPIHLMAIDCISLQEAHIKTHHISFFHITKIRKEHRQSKAQT